MQLFALIRGQPRVSAGAKRPVLDFFQPFLTFSSRQLSEPCFGTDWCSDSATLDIECLYRIFTRTLRRELA